MAKSVLPWSLKGISPEAREIAKKAAAQQGMTIGEWVSAAIRDIGPDAAGADASGPDASGLGASGTGDAGAGTPGAGRVSGPQKATARYLAEIALPEKLDSAKVRDAVRLRVYEAEERVAHIVGPLQDIIEQMSRRLTRLEERRQDQTSPVEEALDVAASQRRLDSW